MKASRLQTVTLLALAGLLGLLAFSGLRLYRNRRAAEVAAENLTVCRQLARQIERLNSTPTRASLHRRSSGDLALKIQQAAQIAKIPESAIVRIDPQANRRMGETPYVQQPTRLEIRQISFDGLVRFLAEVSSSESGLQATSVRLTAPRTPPTA